MVGGQKVFLPSPSCVMTMVDDVVSDEQIVVLYEELRTIRAVCERTGKGRTYVHNRLLKAGVIDHSRPASSGQRNHNSKLTADDVRDIRVLCGTRTQESIGQQFGVSATTVQKICRREIWRNIE